MKRFYIAIVLLLCLLLTGCGFWMNGEYLSVTPHQEQIPRPGDELIQIADNAEMNKALEDLIEAGADGGIMTASAFPSGTLHFYADAIIDDLLKNHPIASYAVEKITYDIGTNRGDPVIAFHIDYLHGRSDILRIKQVKDMNEATNVLCNALGNFETSVLLRVEKYEATDFIQMVQDYGNNNPDIVMEIPRVSTQVYPEKGSDRLIEVNFTYQTSREKLAQMQETVKSVFTSAELYVDETAQVSEIFSRLYAFLMERTEYTIETSITPSYSLLHHGVGDSRAFANIYAKMCRREHLDCRVIIGTREGQPWCWNVLNIQGRQYHVDLLRCKESGSFALLDSMEMDGYVWDYSVFPQE